jgi:hypothetical protein
VLFIGTLALHTRHNDFPYSYHPDEGGKTGQIILGSRNYHHPLLMLSVTDVLSRVAFTKREPQPIVELGRFVSALFAAGAVTSLALLAWLRYGTVAGWGAGIAVALQADLFETAHYMKEDPALIFGLALSLLAAQIWWQAPGKKSLRFLGIACGLATGGKYLGIVALVFALPLVIRHSASALDRRARLRLFALTFVLSFLAANLPLFATKLSSPFRSIRNEVRGVAGGHRGITRQVPHGEYLETLRKNMPPAVLILASGYALVVFATARRRTPPEWATLLFPLGYLAVISCSPKTADRYLLPVNVLLPFLGVLGAAEAGRLIGGAGSGPRRALGGIALAGLAGWQIYGEVPPIKRVDQGFQHDDPTAAAEWIKTNLPASAVIAEDHRVNLSPTKSDKEKSAANALDYKPGKNSRVPQKVYSPNFVPDLGTLDELRANGVTHVAICKQSYGRYFADETKPREGVKAGFDERREFYARVLEEGELLKAWPTGPISYLQPGIKIFRIAPAKASDLR